MTSVRPECRLRAKDEGQSYPRSACLKCGWNINAKITDVCIDPVYNGQLEKEAAEKVEQAQLNVNKAEDNLAYKLALQSWVDSIVKETGLRKEDPEHVPLILMYTLMAMHKGEETTQQHIHDAWALWTLYIRDLPNHESMLPYEQLTERVKALDKIDMWAIRETARTCE
jgi:hypothetical protein